MSARGLAPVVGILLLLVLVTAVAGAVVAVVPGGMTAAPEGPAAIELDVVSAGDDWALVLHHAGGAPVDLEAAELVVSVDGVPLANQPPVPFFNVEGFHPGPTGPFNVASDDTWRAGESGAITVRSASNSPDIGPDSLVTVAVHVDGRPVAEASARPSG